MKRSTFLASVFGFLGIARAQQWKEREPDGANCLSLDTDGTGGNLRSIPCGNIGNRKPALNNQCPVCGTMAKPYHDYKTGSMNLTRCLRCNAAFWQDSK